MRQVFGRGGWTNPGFCYWLFADRPTTWSCNRVSKNGSEFIKQKRALLIVLSSDSLASVRGRTMTIYPRFFLHNHPNLEEWIFLQGDDTNFDVLKITMNRGMSIAHELTHYRDNNCKATSQSNPCRTGSALRSTVANNLASHLHSRDEQSPPHRWPSMGWGEYSRKPNL